MKRILFLILIQFIFTRNLDVQFYSEDLWLYGHPWGSGNSFFNSISYGSGFVGHSDLTELDAVDVDIHFSQHHDSTTFAPVYSINDGSFLGVGVFPGIVNDISDSENPRRLNVTFFEDDQGNLIWDPDNMLTGNFEYLLIMNSDYDFTGETYIGHSAYEEDVLYFCWLRLRPGQEWFSSIPAVLEFRNFWEFSEFYLLTNDEEIQLFWEHENEIAETEDITHYQIYKSFGNGTFERLVELQSSENSYTDFDVINGETYIYYIIGFGENNETIILSDEISGIPNINYFNADLIANWDQGHDASAVNNVSVYNDVWGYVANDGTEFALVGGFDGTYIVDVSTNPNNPELVSFIQGSYSSHRDIKTFGNYMYVGTEANRPDPIILEETGETVILAQGVQVVDISDPENAQLVNEWDGVVQSHNIMEADGYLYVIGSTDYYSQDNQQESWGLDDLIILDLESNPAEPVKVGSWSGEYLHDVCIKDNILYGCGIYSGSMLVFDISDKSNPELLIQWYGIPSSHACWVSDDGNTLFSGSETTGGHIMSWDVSDLNNVELLDQWMPMGGEDFSAHNVFVKDNFLYISYYLYGLQVLDISDPTNLVHVGSYDTYLQNSDYIYNGAWGAYPYLPSGKILISDRQTGLYVIDFLEDNLSANLDKPLNEFRILNSFPNPANPNTIINFYLKQHGNTSFEITNLKGQIIDTINLGNLNSGFHQRNLNFKKYSSGTYWVRVIQKSQIKNNFTKAIPVTILK